MTSKISRKIFDDGVREISIYVNNLERQLENAKKEIAILKKQLSQRTSTKETKPAAKRPLSKKDRNTTSTSAWKKMLIKIYQTRKSPGKAGLMYEQLFDMMPPNAQLKGNVQAYAISQFEGEFPQGLTWGEIMDMKNAKKLSRDQIEIYYAINSFKEACSRKKLHK